MKTISYLTHTSSKMIVIAGMLLLSLTACDRLAEDSRNESATTTVSAPAKTTNKSSSFGFRTLNGSRSQLWARLRKNYDMGQRHKNTADQKRIQRFVTEYRNGEKQLTRMTHRASPYLYYIVEELEKRKLPGELALLPMIESAFEPQANSPKGAAGLWQFMPKTGKYYGLKQDQWYDGRRDVAASTSAALNYLEILHKQFDNNWLLALAAYNAGEGRVSKAIKRNAKAGKPTNFWSLELPKETKDYVPKFLALAEVVAHPEKHDLSLPAIENKPYLVPVNPGKALDFNKVSKLADMEVNEVKRLNPGYRRQSTHPKGPQQLLLPTENAEKLMKSLENKAE